MYLGYIVVLGLVAYIRADGDADVQVVTSGYCSNEILKRKGVDISQYKSKFIFDPKKIKTIPKKPTVPGCMRIQSDNVTIKSPLNTIIAEFELHIGQNADPSQPTLKCKKRSPKCGCGEKDTCMYCDFCKNFKKLVKEVEINNQELTSQQEPNTCDCNISPGVYKIDAEICTPEADEMAENVPTEVLDKVEKGKNEFALFTIVYLYDFRYNSLTTGSQAAEEALKKRKAKGLIGCYVVATNVSV